MIDLTALVPVQEASEQGHRFELLQPPNATPTGNWVTVYGPESAPARSYLERQAREEVQREVAARRRGAAVDFKGLDQREAEAIDFACSLVKRWEVVDDAGAVQVLAPDTVRLILQRQSWARGQIIREASDQGNFVRSSSTNSAPTPLPSSPSA